ncbi:head GIN domain-containing protein [Hyalangium versicolor]|uniref:head GIN domain-containing protein n=1 Tax=Hyalangium versicolor TaxID=2861190 RepID=UPI001CCD4635|nr:head GIN domain-containing protein [Hyalangium versicolor]
MEFVNRGRWAGLPLLVVLMAGCGWKDLVGSGNLIEEERTTPDFVALEVEDGLTTTTVVDPTKPKTVRVLGDDNLVGRVHTNVTGGTLRVFFENDGIDGGWSSHNPLRLEVTVPTLESFKCSGGCTGELSGTVSSSSFAIESSGGAKVKATGLAVDTLSLEASGGGELFLEGQATRVTSEISGASTLKGRGLATREATLESSGGGSTELRVSDTLSVKASGGATLNIIGHPTVLSKDLSGDSSLTFE